MKAQKKLILILIAVGMILVGSAITAINLGSSGQVDLQKGLVGHWDLNGDVKDRTPYANHGVASGTTAVVDRKGQSDKALSFDGVGDMVTLYDYPAGTKITVSVWVKALTNASWRYIVGNHPTINDVWFLGLTDGGIPTFRYNDGGVERTVDASTDIRNDGKWHHLVGVVDTVGHIYVDGVLVNSNANSGNWGGAAIVIGNQVAWFFNGSLDDIRIYDRALSQAEITRLYESYDSGIQVSSTQKGLLVHWSFNGDIKNKTPYPYYGTASGTALVADRKGQPDRAISFDGLGDDFLVTGGIGAVGADFTFTLWVKPDANANADLLFGTQNSGFSRLYRDSGNRLFAQVYDGAFYTASTTSTLLAGNWGFVAGTFDSVVADELKVYFNGVLEDTIYAPNAVASHANIYKLGGDSDFGFFDGTIDDVRVYDHALTAAEILTLYESYDGGIQVSSLQKGLVGYWDFDGDAKDKTPYVVHGTASGTALITDRKGQSDKAYDFSGNVGGDVVNMGDADQFSFNNSKPLSISAWVYPDVSPDDYDCVVCKWDNSASAKKEWLFRFGANDTFEFRIKGSASGSSTTATIPVGEWTHIVGVSDGSACPSALIYINGVESATTQIAGTCGLPAGSAASLYVGADQDTVSGDSLFFDGKIDDVRIYNRELTEAEVLMLYQAYH